MKWLAFRKRRGAARRKASTTEAVFSGSGKSKRDPVRLADALGSIARQKGWAGAMTEGVLLSNWPLLVGPEVAAHVQVESFSPENKELVVVADSPAWATQVKLLQRQMIGRVNEHLGHKQVIRLRVRTQTGSRQRAFPRRSLPPAKEAN